MRCIILWFSMTMVFSHSLGCSLLVGNYESKDGGEQDGVSQDGACTGDQCTCEDGRNRCGGKCCEANLTCEDTTQTCICISNDLPPCNGTCCDEGQVCYNDDCCTPDCGTKRCGPDECGGECGICSPSEHCDNNGQCCPNEVCNGTCCPTSDDVCVSGSCCTPNCSTICPDTTCRPRVCGPGNCSQSCGTCGENQECNSEGMCECKLDCKDLKCGLDRNCATICPIYPPDPPPGAYCKDNDWACDLYASVRCDTSSGQITFSDSCKTAHAYSQCPQSSPCSTGSSCDTPCDDPCPTDSCGFSKQCGTSCGHDCVTNETCNENRQCVCRWASCQNADQITCCAEDEVCASSVGMDPFCCKPDCSGRVCGPAPNCTSYECPPHNCVAPKTCSADGQCR